MDQAARFLSHQHQQQCVQHFRQLTPFRRRITCPEPGQAAVLVPICRLKPEEAVTSGHDELNCWGLLFTKRTAKLTAHAGEVSFPGGKCDAQESPVQAALREAREELGIDRVHVWTQLPPLANHKGNTLVTPVVGEVTDFSLDKLVLSPDEVELAFVKTFTQLKDPNVTGYTQFRVPGTPGYSLPVFSCSPYPIWGMTAIMTFQVLKVLLRGRGYRHSVLFQSPVHKT